MPVRWDNKKTNEQSLSLRQKKLRFLTKTHASNPANEQDAKCFNERDGRPFCSSPCVMRGEKWQHKRRAFFPSWGVHYEVKDEKKSLMWQPCPSVTDIVSALSHFYEIQHSVLYKTLSIKREFRESRFSNFDPMLKSISISNSLSSWPIWVKFGIGNSNIMLLFICQFRGSQLSEVRTLMA